MATNHGRYPRPVTEVAASALALTAGSVNQLIEGRLMRLSASATPWDMAQAWEGREITRWKSRKSLWNKSTIVSLCTTLPTGAVHPLFTLELPMTRTPEEVAQAASTYMMLLNLQRKED